MMAADIPPDPPEGAESATGYVLDDQVGFLLRRAHQRHQTIFANQGAGGLTSMQFSTLFRLAAEPDGVSQNALGRMVAMDAATTKGVVSRLQARGLIRSEPDLVDKRRYNLSATAEGHALLAELIPQMRQITTETLSPLAPKEQQQLIRLLRKIT